MSRSLEKPLTIFEKSLPGSRAYSLPRSDEAFEAFQPPETLRRAEMPPLPEVSELELIRHFSGLAAKNMGIDTHFYPLGSCTMKYNPRACEQAAVFPGFMRTHPLAPDEAVQGNLRLIHELIVELCQITGMTAGTLTPNAGAQGEFVGLRMIDAYHQKNGEGYRCEILIPDSAHGTNPATAVMAGYKTVAVKTDERGDMDLDDLKSLVSERTSGLMLTNPNTLGLFSPVIQEIAEVVHGAGGLLYCDGANLNAILEIARIGDMGFDVTHLNLHKTFSTPHGGGGPGSGPVLCNDRLKAFLPVPRVEKGDAGYRTVWQDRASIGQIASFHGNFGVCLRAYLYVKLNGRKGLRRVAETAVVNANYLKKRLEKLLTEPFKQICMHEFVLQADNYLDKGVKALDIAKRLLDYGFHAPTIYFPLTIKECMLVEPTETESKATLDRFVAAMEAIVQEIQEDPDQVLGAPQNLSVKRLDEVRAVKQPLLTGYESEVR